MVFSKLQPLSPIALARLILAEYSIFLVIITYHYIKRVNIPNLSVIRPDYPMHIQNNDKFILPTQFDSGITNFVWEIYNST